MNEVQHDRSRLVFPWAGAIYNALEPFAYPLIRISLGAMLVPHGYGKLFHGGAAATSRNAIFKFLPAFLNGGYFIGCIEFFCGLMLVFGLLTRLAAGAVAIQMFVISAFILWPVWEWTQKGMEYAVFMMLIAIAILIHGGGKYSLDSKLPKTL